MDSGSQPPPDEGPTLRDVAMNEQHPHSETARTALVDNVAHWLHVSAFIERFLEDLGVPYSDPREMSEQIRALDEIKNDWLENFEVA